MKHSDYRDVAKLLLSDAIETLANQSETEDQAKVMIAALEIVTEKLEQKFSLNGQPVEMCGRCEHEIDLHGLFTSCKVIGCQCPQFFRVEAQQ